MAGARVGGWGGVRGTSIFLSIYAVVTSIPKNELLCRRETEFLAVARNKDMDSVLKPAVETGGRERSARQRKNPFGLVKVQLKRWCTRGKQADCYWAISAKDTRGVKSVLRGARRERGGRAADRPGLRRRRRARVGRGERKMKGSRGS